MNIEEVIKDSIANFDGKVAVCYVIVHFISIIRKIKKSVWMEFLCIFLHNQIFK